MEPTYAGSWSDMAQPCDLWIMKWRSAWPIFQGPVILSYILISWRLFDVCSMNQYDPTFDLKINVGHCDLYSMVQWFCLISWRLFDVCTSYFGSMNQYNQTIDLKINVGHCDLYSMVQWFCLLSWRLFDAWTLLFGIMSQYDPKFYLKKNIGHWLLPYIIVRLKLFLYIKKWHRPGVFVPLRVLALVLFSSV